MCGLFHRYSFSVDSLRNFELNCLERRTRELLFVFDLNRKKYVLHPCFLPAPSLIINSCTNGGIEKFFFVCCTTSTHSGMRVASCYVP